MIGILWLLVNSCYAVDGDVSRFVWEPNNRCVQKSGSSSKLVHRHNCEGGADFVWSSDHKACIFSYPLNDNYINVAVNFAGCPGGIDYEWSADHTRCVYTYGINNGYKQMNVERKHCGGSDFKWSSDRKQCFYYTPDGKQSSVKIKKCRMEEHSVEINEPERVTQ